MGWFSHKIKVTLVDDSNGRTIAVTKLQPDALPESFETDTTLHLHDQDWFVVTASPTQRADYSKTRRLMLRLRRVERMNPADVLFSLPSICDRIPGCAGASVTDADLIMHEDDWRQFELVASENDVTIDRQFEAIRNIHQNHSEEIGWRKLHTRIEPDPPIPRSLSLDDVRRILGPTLEIHNVSFEGAAHVIADGFSLRTNDNLTLYGIAHSGKIEVLGIYEHQVDSLSEGTIAGLVTMADCFELELVHWCRCQRAMPSVRSFRELIMWGKSNAEH